MSNPSIYHVSLPEAHHYFANESYKYGVKLLKQNNRNSIDNEQMEHAAHATCFHQNALPEDIDKKMRNLWLLTAVYSALENADKAQAYALQCLQVSNNFTPDLPYITHAYAMNAQAQSLLAQHLPDEAHGYLQLSADIADEIANPDQKHRFLEDCGLA